MKWIIKKCHRYLYLTFVIFFYIILFPLFYYYSRKFSRFAKLNAVRRFYAYITSLTAGFIYSYRIESPIDWSENYIICANHTSNLDISAVSIAVKNNFAFMGKDELLENPVLKIFFKTIDIPLNRESRISAFKAFKKAQEYLNAGMSVIIFPEGKIGEEFPPILHEFKNGPFKLAIEQQVPIIPISFINTWSKMWDDGLKYGTKPGICDIFVHKPVQTKGLSQEDTEKLKEMVYGLIESKLT